MIEAKRGMAVKKIHKPNKEGTRVTYSCIQSSEELDIYYSQLEQEYKENF
jgi:hypothetical protein